MTAGVVGCNSEMQTREQATTAALSKYPGGTAKASETYKLAVVDHQDTSTVEVLNLTDNAVPAAKLWVNGRYVAKITGIQARGNVSVKYSDLLESGAGLADLALAKGTVAKAELQVGSDLYTVQGPTIK